MNSAPKSTSDWVSDKRAHFFAWWMPKGAIIATLFASMPVRAVSWIVALAWMGTACVFNARRCGRTHCRYTGPFYLAMILPVLALASGIIVADFYGWLMIGFLIVCTGWILRWGTEMAWGKFTHS